MDLILRILRWLDPNLSDGELSEYMVARDDWTGVCVGRRARGDQ